MIDDASGHLRSASEPIVSYSQNAEDVRLWRVFRHVENGFYVDVGAADPNVDSVTRLFYEHGWSGINIEPSPCFETLSEARTRDVNLRVAIGESEGSVPFFLTYPYLGMSTCDSVDTRGRSRMRSNGSRRATVPQRRLESILESTPGAGRSTSSRSTSKERRRGVLALRIGTRSVRSS